MNAALRLVALAAGLAALPPLEIGLVHDDERERQTKQQLERLLSTYDVSARLFTRKHKLVPGPAPIRP